MSSKNIHEWEKMQSSIEPINQIIGGFKFSDLVLLTGRSGGGKSTLLRQEVLYAIENDYSVFMYSSKFSDHQLLRQILFQAAGAWNIEEKSSDTGGSYVISSEYAKEQITEQYGKKIILFENREEKEPDLLSVFKRAYNIFGCRIFAIDDITRFYLEEVNASEKDPILQQETLISRFKNFARQFNALIYFVFPPRKNTGEGIIDNANKALGGKQVALADTIISVDKYPEKEGNAEGLIKIHKDRFIDEVSNIDIGFEPKSGRLYSIEQPDFKDYRFSWER